jgi:hypothetical protein
LSTRRTKLLREHHNLEKLVDFKQFTYVPECAIQGSPTRYGKRNGEFVVARLLSFPTQLQDNFTVFLRKPQFSPVKCPNGGGGLHVKKTDAPKKATTLRRKSRVSAREQADSIHQATA